jgi:7-cyano-7-deazaguanine synthase in queuosine biosynthesis
MEDNKQPPLTGARAMELFHATTPKKARKYRETGRIIAPVRGFNTLFAAMAWACKTGRTVILKVEGEDCHKLPDHHNEFGTAWWVDHDVTKWKCVFS